MTAVTQGLLRPEEGQLPLFEKEPSWLSDYRKKALAVYLTSKPEPNPLYTKYANLSKFEDSGFSLAQKTKHVDAIPGDFSDLRDDSIFSLRAGHESYMDTPALPKGVMMKEMSRAVVENGDLLRELFQKSQQPEEDMFVALNSALMTGGVFIHIPKSAVVEKPIHTVFIDRKPGTAHFHRNLIFADEGSDVTILSEVLSSENFDSPSLYSEVTDIFAQPGAHVHYSALENLSRSSAFLSNKRALADRDSNISWVSSYIGADVTRARADTKFTGPGANSEDYEILFGNGKQRFDVVTDLHHEVPNTSGRITVRSVLKEKSRSLLRGMIRIGEGGANTSSFLAEHGMLLSKDAKCDAIPGLEILTNGVKATHSASVSQMDEEHLYYLQTRGLAREEAEKMMVLGFFDPVISRIPTDVVRDKLRFQIEDKWNNVISLKSDRHLDELEFEKYVKDQIKTTSNLFEGHYKYR